MILWFFKKKLVKFNTLSVWISTIAQVSMIIFDMHATWHYLWKHFATSINRNADARSKYIVSPVQKYSYETKPRLEPFKCLKCIELFRNVISFNEGETNEIELINVSNRMQMKPPLKSIQTMSGLTCVKNVSSIPF